MKITIEDSLRTKKSVSASVPTDDLDIWQVSELLLRPLLLAYGYMPGSVDNILMKLDDERLDMVYDVEFDPDED